MSSSEDSETAEWEREQMIRGRGARQQVYTGQQGKQGTTQQESSSTAVDATKAKELVNDDIRRLESEIESIKTKIGANQRDIMRAEKRIAVIKTHISNFESLNPFFEQLASMTTTAEVLNFLSKNRATISKLPSDQRETLDLFEKDLKDSLNAMDVDETS